MPTTATATTTVVTIAIIAVLTAGWGAALIAVAYANEDDACQHGRRAGLQLSDWLKGSGFAHCGSVVAVALGMPIAYAHEPTGSIIIGVTLVGNLLFHVAWEIVGIVVMATNENNTCIGDMTTLGDMSISAAVLGVVFAGCLPMMIGQLAK